MSGMFNGVLKQFRQLKRNNFQLYYDKQKRSNKEQTETITISIKKTTS
jgi:hypothetical protein